MKDVLLRSPLIGEIKKYLTQTNASSQIFLYAPYIQTKILAKLVENIPNKIIVITTWEPRDWLSGSSELELYPFCKDKKITLYRNEKIHLKVYSVNLESAIISSGNISNRGLLPGGNYECGAFVDKLSSVDRLYLEKIRNDAILVNDKIYQDGLDWYDKQIKYIPKEIKLEDIIPSLNKSNFLISALPMTKNVDELVIGYEKINSGLEPSDDSEITACVFHDLANYNIEPGLSKKEFEKKLRIQFFSHPFIQKIDKFIDQNKQFGEIRRWIEDNCANVPIPSRREITANVQVLYKWFEKLGDGKYVIDIPGRHSERIRKIR